LENPLIIPKQASLDLSINQMEQL